MIKSFADKETARLWETGQSRRIPATLKQRATDKLQMLHAVATVESLRMPPSNNLEKLSGDRAGHWSLRINKQYRIVFRFVGGDAQDVAIVDYH
ncbi:MAG: type II toxin-antitoxin system RelE/ParE family toxin [Alphaproteobacteria bacterium]|nr:type II toxin-antitoxin system RelE/ParE family toxin [Alphaproteobacteria bacterium]